ncbi:MAG: tRNA (N(6)-L-threonylcarbamoyladenosine(37)-C(2))-methylthiotransferase MtaB [Halanaerobiales bacterium]|nr:tRNA (N(6)-L-threonylcarbamoyladenosine(37)-C(2))-methylthiotransferase MtaB [Halanaerobiales bacterium]
MKSVAFYTLGCKVNHYETEAMMDKFIEKGYEIKNYDDIADLYVINSCTVTTQAASKSRKYARRAKRRNEDAKVIMVGCYPQVDEDEVSQIEEIDYIMGTSGKSNIVELVEEKISGKNKNKLLKDNLNYGKFSEFEEMSIKDLSETTRAYIKIQEGCNQFCSYCIIPYARGKMRSRDKNNIINEVTKLINQKGVKEIVLTGIHLGAYGIENNDKYALVNLIEELSEIKGLKRIRLSSIEVTEVNDRLLNLIKQNEKVCPHLHLPLQSGSNKILDKMNRPYTKEEFREKVNKFREEIPHLAITTDVIVGFPGETIKEFRETYDFIKEIGFSRLHVFPFSRRKNTPAYDMKPRVRGDIKSKNAGRLRKLNKKLMSQFNRKFLGESKNIIIEDNKDNETGLYTGYTDNYIKVLVDPKEDEIEKLKNVKLIKCHNYESLRGKIL